MRWISGGSHMLFATLGAHTPSFCNRVNKVLALLFRQNDVNIDVSVHSNGNVQLKQTPNPR